MQEDVKRILTKLTVYNTCLNIKFKQQLAQLLLEQVEEEQARIDDKLQLIFQEIENYPKDTQKIIEGILQQVYQEQDINIQQ